jgi:hypothetical protein
MDDDQPGDAHARPEEPHEIEEGPMSDTRTIEPGVAEEAMWDNGGAVGPWVLIDAQYISEYRTRDSYWLVLRHDDGTYWGLTCEPGKQGWPWDKATGPLELTRLYPHEVTRVEYREDAPKAAAELLPEFDDEECE